MKTTDFDFIFVNDLSCVKLSLDCTNVIFMTANTSLASFQMDLATQAGNVRIQRLLDEMGSTRLPAEMDHLDRYPECLQHSQPHQNVTISSEPLSVAS